MERMGEHTSRIWCRLKVRQILRTPMIQGLKRWAPAAGSILARLAEHGQLLQNVVGRYNAVSVHVGDAALPHTAK